jgi:hypothetical protein
MITRRATLWLLVASAVLAAILAWRIYHHVHEYGWAPRAPEAIDMAPHGGYL